MKDPIKNHYVPQVYLKHFISRKHNFKLFTLKIKSKYLPRIKVYNTSAVCYKKNLYTLSKAYNDFKFKKVDKYTIENTSFSYESSLLPSIWNKVFRRRPFSLNDRFDLCRIILDFKKRNPSFAAAYTEDDLVNTSVEKVILQFRESFSSMWNEPSPDGNTYGETMENVEKIAKTHMSSLQSRIDLYRESLIESDIVSKVFHENVCMLSISSILVYENFTSTPFITNDNPGYVITTGGNVENINMREWSFYVFPVSPNHLCVISKNGDDLNRRGLQKGLAYEKATSSIIHTVNLAAVANCTEMIISDDQNTIQNLLPYWSQLKNKPDKTAASAT